MPLSLLSFNLSLLAYLFFSILLLMLMGMVVLSLNLEHFIETGLTYLFFFWEYTIVRSLVLKNLMAHRLRNRKTAVMFSMSLAFIIFVSVAFKLQVQTYEFEILRSAGTRFSTNGYYLFTRDGRSSLELFLKQSQYSAVVKGYAYRTQGLDQIVTNLRVPIISNVGMWKRGTSRIRAITPQYFRVLKSEFLQVSLQGTESGYSLDEKLYTADATTRGLISASFMDQIGIQDLDDTYLLSFIEPVTGGFPRYKYKLQQPLAMLGSAPGGSFSAFPTDEVLLGVKDIFVSLPTLQRMANYTFSMKDIRMDRLYVEVYDNAPATQVAQFKAEFKRFLSVNFFMGLRDAVEELQPVEIGSTVMGFFFNFTAVIALFMCFFSLVSNMWTNIYEQAKEIGVLRAMGMRRFSIVRVYIYESFILILTAAVAGFAIGLLMSYTMTIQRVLFTRLPISFVFPYDIAVTVFILAMLFAMTSSLAPIISLLREPIVVLQRRIVT